MKKHRQKECKTIRRNYENLANAIILQASEDYRTALKWLLYYQNESVEIKPLKCQIRTQKKCLEMQGECCLVKKPKDCLIMINKYIAVKSDKKRIEKFFHGKWFSTLTNIDAEYLIKQLESEVE